MLITLQQFQGPLDILLSLIEKEKLDISNISLAKVADQYIAFIQNQSLALPDLIYFLEIAAKLVVLKTRLLLPYLEPQEDEDEEEELAERLKNYKKYFELAQNVLKLWRRAPKFLDPGAERRSRAIGQDKRLHISVSLLHKTILKLKKKTEIFLLPQERIKKVFNIQEKITQILVYLERQKKMCFSELLMQKQSKIEVIVSFLALLELSKSRFVYLRQEGLFEEIMIVSISH